MIAVITGGTKGIGKAIVEKFASQGYDIITCSRSISDLNSLRKEIEEKYKVNCHVLECDFNEKNSAKEFYDFVLSKVNVIDILVNNSGIFIPDSIKNNSFDDIENMMQVNIISIIKLTKYLLPLISKSTKPHIFNICSIASIAAYSNGGTYSVSKHALYGFSKNIREELKKDGIRVTAILPGATWSESWKGIKLPQERLMPAEDIATMIVASYSLSKVSDVEEIIIRPILGDITENEF